MKNAFKITSIFFLVLLSLAGSSSAQTGSSGASSSGGGSTNSNNPAPSSINQPPALVSDIFYDFAVFQATDGDINAVPIYTTFFPNSLAAFVCDFRRLFCSKLALAIVTVAIFTCGMMILTGTMTWTWAIIVVTASVTMIYGDQMTGFVLSRTFGFFDLSLMSKACVCF